LYQEKKSVSIAEGRKGRSKGVYLRVVEEGVYLTIKITPDRTGVCCRKKRWKEADGTGL